MARAASRKVRAVQAVNKPRHSHELEREDRDRQSDRLRCTFENAERNYLLDGMRMSTRDKIQSFEDMLDFAWRTGAIKHLRNSTQVTGGHQVSATQR